jgi:hypothetical protein
MLRSYKGIPGSILAIKDLRARYGYDIRLTVAGEPKDTDICNRLVAEAAENPSWLTVRLKRLSDEDMWREVTQQDLVLATYDSVRFLNSGIVLYALSAGTPVAVTHTEVSEEISRSFQAGDVLLVDASNTTDSLATHLSGWTPHRVERPTHLEWEAMRVPISRLYGQTTASRD